MSADAAVREKIAVLTAVTEAGRAHVERDFAEAYHVLYWLLVDHFGMSHVPDGPFAEAEKELARLVSAHRQPAP